jgi:hypothetical protein
VVALTVASIAWRAWQTVPSEPGALRDLVGGLRPGWLVVAAALVVSEGVLGGLRVFALARVLWPHVRLRTAIVSEFLLMFCAGVTPGQAGTAVWLASGTGAPLCFPDSVLQGHAVWLLATAVSVALLYDYVRLAPALDP